MNVLDDFNTAIYFTLHNNNMDAKSLLIVNFECILSSFTGKKSHFRRKKRIEKFIERNLSSEVQSAFSTFFRYRLLINLLC